MKRIDSVLILLVDDDEALCRAFEREASTKDVLITTTTSLAEARATVEDGMFDLVVSDFHVGEETSEDFVRTLSIRGIPVVVVTGNAPAAAAALGSVVDIYTKPVSLDTLMRLAQRLREESGSSTVDGEDFEEGGTDG